MRNVKAEAKGDILTITIDLSQKGELSNKGQGPNMTIASTQGNHVVATTKDGRPFTLGLNLYAPPIKK